MRLPICPETAEPQSVSALAIRPLKDEAAVIAAARKGHNGSFELLVKRYESRILLLALNITRNWQDAEDVKQLSFQKAYCQLHRFQGRSSFLTWLTRIAINESLILLRKTYRRREVFFEADGSNDASEPLEIHDPENGPELTYQEQERRRALSLALKKLTPKIRTAIQLREIEEKSSQETAEILKISVSAVKSRVFHGRRQLQKELERHLRVRPMFCNRASPVMRCQNPDRKQSLRANFGRYLGF